ncbi:unnamed protein product [[Candida] boidinii]|nr:unnamed protein product [[Candida] boidinii]
MFYACVWTVFVSIVFIFPNYMPVDAENMNYTVVLLGFVFIGAGGWYAIDAKKWYKGPVGNVDEEYDQVIESIAPLHTQNSRLSYRGKVEGVKDNHEIEIKDLGSDNASSN